VAEATEAQERRSAQRAALERVLSGSKRLARSRPKAAEWSSRRDPALAGELVDELVKREGWALDISLGSLAATWPEIVGPQVADHCAPEAFAEGELTVRADSAAWATQIRLLAGQLLTALERALGEGLVSEIKVLGPAGPKRRGRHITRR
jgi:predicted nucleic acid-binding Zn ribbon protein